MLLCSILTAAFAWSATALAQNSTFLNPVLPGWHSDPSCAQVNGTFFCVTSTFGAFPGLPIYASRDLVNWKHISHAWNRESQLPGYSWASEEQQDGMFAATIRFHQNTFYVIVTFLKSNRVVDVLFTSTDPYDDKAWTNGAVFDAEKIDPDIFWDDDGKVYVASQGIILQELDLETGTKGPAKQLWNGTGGVWPEGPHIYKKDDYYYLLIAEGGTGFDHAVTMARARNITGPYLPSPHNPHLTNRGTSEYLQTVGHADLVQDARGNWWALALATRVGPNGASYPMGRETVLTPVTWNTDEWPIFQPVSGNMTGWTLPPRTRDIPGDGPFNSDPDMYDFPEGNPIPRNLVHFRVPRNGTFETTSKGLQVIPGRNNITGRPGGSEPASKAIPFIGRRQTDSTFDFSVDLDFTPLSDGQEAGITAFLTQDDNIQLGLTLIDEQISLRFNASDQNTTVLVPNTWVDKPLRLQIHMPNPDQYTFSASLASDESTSIEIGKASATQLSGRSGPFVGTLIGVYATCNGAGEGLDCPADTPKAYFKRWRYAGINQYISATEFVPSSAFNEGYE